MYEKLKILHLEDSDCDAEMINRILTKANINTEIQVVDSRKKYENALLDFYPDIILSDNALPTINSLEALTLLRQTELRIPFILITGTTSEEFIIDIIKQGVDDYILKDRLERLPMAVRNSLNKFRLEKEQQAFLNELEKNEIRFRTLMENNFDAITLRDENFSIIYRNPSAIKMLGWEMEDKNGKSLMDTAHPDDRGIINKALEDVIISSAKPIQLNFRTRHKDGHYIWVEGMMMNMLHDKNINAYVSNFRDITERKKTEDKIINLNRLYAFLSQINQTIVQVKDEQSLFKEVCRIAVQEGKFKMAWIGIADIQRRKIRLAASNGANEKEIELLSDYTYDNDGPIEKVLSGLDYYVVEDIRKETNITRSEYMMERGCYSGISLALRKGGDVIGTLTIYATEINFFNKEEIKLLAESAWDISFALNVFEIARLKLLADKKLEESKSNLQAIFENTSEGFILADLDGIVKAFNNKSKDFTFQNIGKELRIGGSIYEYVHESRKGIYNNDMLKVLNGETIQYDYKYERSDGELRWFCFAGNPVYNKEEIVGLCIATTDITERKLAEQELVKSELRYRQIVETAQEGIITVDENQKISYANKKFAEIMEYDEDELIGKSIFDIMDEESVVQGKLNLEKRKNGISETIESVFKSKSGKDIWTNIAVTPVFNEQKKFMGTLAMVSDITHRKRIEERIRLKANLLKTIGQAVVATDLNGQVKYWNHVAEKMYGYSMQEAIGRNILDVMPTNQTREEAVKIVEELTKGNTWTGDFQVKRKDGTEFYVYGSGSPIFEQDGSISGIISVTSDITERKYADKLLNESKSNLRTIIENTDASIYSLDKDFRFIVFNKRLENGIKDAYGLDIKSGDKIFEFLEKLDLAEAQDWKGIYTKALGGQVVKFEKEYDIGGVKTYMSFSIHPISEENNVIGLACYALDITTQKESENALRKSEMALAEAQHVAKYGNWNFDLITKNINWSQELYNVFGVDMETFGNTYESFLNLLDKDDQELVLRNTLHTRKTGEPFDFNCHITTPAGEKRIIHVLGYAKCNSGGNTIRLYGTVQDITERKKVESELIELNEQFRNLNSHIQTIRENERTSIAREVHDELGQQMTSLKMDIAWINGNITERHPEMVERLDNML